MLRWSAHPPGASCQPLLRLASAVVLLTAGNAVSVPVSPSLSSSSSALSFFSRGTSPRSTTAVWLPEHVLMYPALYKHKTQMHSHRNDLTAAANTVSIGGNDGGGEGKEAVVRDTTQRSNKEFRLPASLRPIHYSVRVQPFINGNYSVHGSVQIDIEVLQATSNITLHVYGMDIHTHGIQLQAAEGDEETASVPQITHFVDDLDVEIFTAHLDGVLEAGRRVRYTIPYEGTLAFYMGGFYGHRYTDVDGTDNEHFMLYDPLEDDEMDFARVTWVQAHELAHQWFGNLVTPRWWSDLWLSEGISSYMSDFAMQETAMVSQSVIEQARSAVHELFPEDDKVTAVPVFNQQIDVQYGSVVQDDLFHHLTKAAHEAYTLPQDLSVKTILDTWIHETGYPLVTVTRSPSGISATAYQEKYLWLQDDSLPIDHFSTWWVPLTYTTQDLPDFSDTRVKVWLKDTETQTPVHNLPPKDQWVIFNLQQTGYYRVNYDDHNWNLLIQQLLTDHQLIHVNNRVQMIDDILNLASSGKVSYKIALSLVEYMKNENETLPWRVFQRNMEHMKQILETTPAHEGFKKYMWSLLVPLWDLVGFEKITEVQTIQQKHSQAVKWACHYSLPSCVHLAASLYAQWMLTPENIKYVVVPRDLWGTVYCTAIAHGGEAEWDFAWQQYFLSNDTHHKEQLVAALSCSRDTWAENGYLDLALTSETKLRTQNTLQMFYSVASSSGGKPLAWNFLTRRWYGDSGAAAEQLVVAAAETLTSQQDMEKVHIWLCFLGLEITHLCITLGNLLLFALSAYLSVLNPYLIIIYYLSLLLFLLFLLFLFPILLLLLLLLLL
ncbi:Aminopeptidase N [Portunus trituberculatus]|uniref:Aminopeptidase N n=1 Tax=Portunus trituberculatus TaxID=210409 RepID=A0A5B7DR27_PORTR|nr:Aminopeptidase N [Portunus trituberculatus]